MVLLPGKWYRTMVSGNIQRKSRHIVGRKGGKDFFNGLIRKRDAISKIPCFRIKAALTVVTAAAYKEGHPYTGACLTCSLPEGKDGVRL